MGETITRDRQITVRGDGGEENVVKEEDVIAVVSSKDGKTSTVIYVEHSIEGPSTPPTIKFADSATPQVSRRPSCETPVQTHIIISTGSGGNLARKFYEEDVKPVLKVLYPADFESFQIHTTKSSTSILELADNVLLPAANEGTRLRIILLSGDGGIVDLVNGLQSTSQSHSESTGPKSTYAPPQVIILPLGTANALYHSIYGARDNTWGLKALAAHQFTSLPTFTVSFSPGARLLVDEGRTEEALPKDETGNQILHGAVVCSWGMHATLVADSDTAEYRKFGIDRFKMAANEALYPSDDSLPHAYKARVSLLRKDGSWQDVADQEHEHLYVLATMVSNLEKTFTISPASKPLDGSLRLVRFGPTSGDKAMRIMGLAYQGGKHVEDEMVGYEEVEGLRIAFEGREEERRWRRICVDGKIVRVEAGGWVEMRKTERRVLDVAVL